MISLYLDMDGVFCDFNKKIAEIFPEFYDLKGIYADEIRTHSQELLFNKMTDKILSESDFWESLDWMPNGRILHDFIHDNINQFTVTVLTSPLPNDPRCSFQKMKWITKNFEIPIRHFIAHREKWNYVHHHPGPKQILIDDRESNIIGWNRTGDGLGILHNDEDVNYTINTLKNIIKNAGI